MNQSEEARRFWEGIRLYNARHGNLNSPPERTMNKNEHDIIKEYDHMGYLVYCLMNDDKLDDPADALELALYPHLEEAIKRNWDKNHDTAGVLIKLLKQLAEYTDELQQKFDILDNADTARLINDAIKAQPDAPETLTFHAKDIGIGRFDQIQIWPLMKAALAHLPEFIKGDWAYKITIERLPADEEDNS